MSSLRALIFPTAALVAMAPWCAAAAPHVPGFERLKRGGSEWQAEAGALLLSELSCLACHGTPQDQPAGLGWKPGPDLGDGGNRLRASFIRAFLADPAKVDPGTTMPDVLSGRADRAEVIEDLTHHLMQQREKTSAREPIAGVPKRGRELFHSIGCVACHAERSFARLGEKYAPHQLAHFLQRPLKARPAGRMPHQNLNAKESAAIAAFLDPSPSPAEAEFAVDADRAKRGRKAFADLGCAACHGRPNDAKALPMRDPQRGCLAEKPGPGVPLYALSAEQRGAIRTALAQPSRTDDPKRAARRLMLQRDCFSCHARDSIGGPAPEIAEHFTSTKDDLGDLGRLPPPLDGVGRKFQRGALENVLRGRDPVRKYMRVRMPDFGEELARELSALLAKADADPNERPALAQENPNQVGRNEWGRELVGTSGYACIACHDLHGHASLGLGAYDLAEMPKRLRPEWVRDFLLNPAAFPTGSRMPAFWPDGKPAKAKMGGGSADRQIDSIRVYLTEADQSLPPEGIADRAAFELKPADRPIIFRTFLSGAGTHAIAVGFPGGVNVAFDAFAVRWAMAWRGRFLDADGTWNQRHAKMEKPLGEELVRLEDAGAVRIAGENDLTPQFRGYRVGADGVPIFQYDLGDLRIEDRMEPTERRGLRRTLRVTGQTERAVQFNARTTPGLKMLVSGGASLPVRLDFRDGAAELVEELAW